MNKRPVALLLQEHSEYFSLARIFFPNLLICIRKVHLEDFPGGEASCLKSMCHSPTAIALGSSAIVKVSGRNCFRTLYGSLGQIRLGLPKGSAEGSTKVPPSFHCGSSKGAARIHQGPSSFVVSVVLWSKSVVRSYKVPWKVHQGFTEVPPRLRKFCDLSRLGQIRFGVPKGSVEGSLITSLNWSPSSSTLFCIFPEQRQL